jgi:hypothetical protein
MSSALPGSESRAKAHLGFPRNVGDPVDSAGIPGRRYRVTNSRPGEVALGLVRSETQVQQRYHQAKETKCGGKVGRKS